MAAAFFDSRENDTDEEEDDNDDDDSCQYNLHGVIALHSTATRLPSLAMRKRKKEKTLLPFCSFPFIVDESQVAKVTKNEPLNVYLILPVHPSTRPHTLIISLWGPRCAKNCPPVLYCTRMAMAIVVDDGTHRFRPTARPPAHQPSSERATV